MRHFVFVLLVLLLLALLTFGPSFLRGIDRAESNQTRADLARHYHADVSNVEHVYANVWRKIAYEYLDMHRLAYLDARFEEIYDHPQSTWSYSSLATVIADNCVTAKQVRMMALSGEHVSLEDACHQLRADDSRVDRLCEISEQIGGMHLAAREFTDTSFEATRDFEARCEAIREDLRAIK